MNLRDSGDHADVDDDVDLGITARLSSKWVVVVVALSLSVSEIDSKRNSHAARLSVADVQASGRVVSSLPPEEREVSAESRLRAGLEITDSIITSSANNSPQKAEAKDLSRPYFDTPASPNVVNRAASADAHDGSGNPVTQAYLVASLAKFVRRGGEEPADRDGDVDGDGDGDGDGEAEGEEEREEKDEPFQQQQPHQNLKQEKVHQKPEQRLTRESRRRKRRERRDKRKQDKEKRLHADVQQRDAEDPVQTVASTPDQKSGSLRNFGLSRSPVRPMEVSRSAVGSPTEGRIVSNTRVGGAALFSADVEIITRATNYCNLPPRGVLTVTSTIVRFICFGDMEGEGDGSDSRNRVQQWVSSLTFIIVRIRALVHGMHTRLLV